MADTDTPFVCPGCGERGITPAILAGDEFPCPRCGRAMVTEPTGSPTGNPHENTSPPLEDEAAGILSKGDTERLPDWRPAPVPGEESEADHEQHTTPSESLPSTRVPPFPGSIRAAGIVWVLTGTLFILAAVGGILSHNIVQVKQPTDGCSTQLGLLIGISFLVAGVRVVFGFARDVLLPSILSIVVGLVYLVIGAIGLWVAENPNPRVSPNLILTLLISGIALVALGGVLLLMGVFALSARSRYRRWWTAVHQPRRRHRRRRRPDPEEPGEGDSQQP